MVKHLNIICKEDINLNRLKYVIDFINDHPLKPMGLNLLLNNSIESSRAINYTNDNISGNIIPVQNLFFSKNKEISNELYINEYYLDYDKYYSVENIQKLPYFFYVGKIFAFDIFETIFFHISRFEEYFFSDRHLDKHGRMKSAAQLLVKNNLHHIPVVDQLVFGFFKMLGYNTEKRKTDFTLSHDIDIIRKFSGPLKLPKSIIRIILMGQGVKGVFHIVKSYFKALKNKEEDPYYTYEWLFRDEDYFKNKIVFFVAGGKTRQDLYSNYYLKELPSIIEKAKKNNYDIGLHPSYNAFIDKSMMRDELELLEIIAKEKISRVRMHFLRLNIHKTFEIIEELGFEYDSTLGYNDDIGFRCGTGFEYYPYNFLEERRWKFKELPLIIMDSSLLKSCVGDPACFNSKVNDFLKLNKFNTHINFNFHNSTFDNYKTGKKLRNFYIDLFNLTIS